MIQDKKIPVRALLSLRDYGASRPCLLFALIGILIFCPVLQAQVDNSLLLCGSSQVREGVIHTANGVSMFQPLWNWRPERSSGLPMSFIGKFMTIDDCKPASDGKEILVSSSGGAVAIVSYPSGKTLFYASVPMAHSIALLPGGLVAAASSTAANGNKIELFNRKISDRPIYSLPLPASHGVVWDKRRNVLWALGDQALLRLRLLHSSKNSYRLQIEHSYPVSDGGGHDLVLSKDGNTLYMTTSPAVRTFDIINGSFADYKPLAGLQNVKSISFNSHTGQLAYTQADPRTWWTYTLHFINPNMNIELECRAYKVRWNMK